MYDNNSSWDRHLSPRDCSPLTSTLPVTEHTFLLSTSCLRNVFLVVGSNPTFAFHICMPPLSRPFLIHCVGVVRENPSTNIPLRSDILLIDGKYVSVKVVRPLTYLY